MKYPCGCSSKKEHQKNRIPYRSMRMSLLGEKERVVRVMRPSGDNKRNHIAIELQRLIRREDFFNGDVHAVRSFRHKKKLLTMFTIETEAAYALCILLVDALGLDIDGLFKDSEVRRIIAESIRKREAKKRQK